MHLNVICRTGPHRQVLL